MGCVHVYDIKDEQETSLFFNVLTSFINIIDNEATNICLHESDIEIIVPSDEIVEIISSVENGFYLEEREGVYHVDACEYLFIWCKDCCIPHVECVSIRSPYIFVAIIEE